MKINRACGEVFVWVNKSITTLNLNLNIIGPDGAAAIGKALENNTTLTKLDGIENKKALRIVETNRSRVAELQEFCIRGAARVGVVGPADNTVLFEKGTNLQELVLQSSKIAHHSYFQELLVWISKHQHLRRLRLNAIGLTDDDLSVLVSSEDGLTFLEELDLRSNQLTTVPAELGDPKRFGKLQKLLVSRNAELLKRDDELGRRARSDVNVLGVDAGIQVLQLLRLGSSKLKQIPRTRLQLVTVGNFKVGKSTLLERGWLAPSLKRKTAKWSRLERTTIVLLFNCLDSEAGLHWMVRDLPGQPEFYATNLHFLSADCAVFLLVCKATDDERNREQQLRLWLSALDSLGAYHRACCTVLVCTHQDQLEPPQLQRTQEWLQQLAPRLSSEFKHAHLDASGMLLDCETEKAPAMLEDLRKRVARAGRNLLSIQDLANVPEFLVMAQDGLAKWRNKHLTKWHASYAEALDIVKSLPPTSAPELVLRELIYQGDVMEFGTELVLSPVWLALALAVIVRPHGHPFYGLKTNRGGSISRKRLCLHCRFGPKLAKEEDVPQVLRFLQVLDVIAPLSHKPVPLSAATPVSELTEDSQAAAAPPPPLFRQPSFDISSAEQIMIPSSVGERYSGVIFAPRDLGFGFGERCLAAGVKFSQRKTTELLFPPGFMAVLAPRLLSKKLGPDRLAIYFGTHEFCFREEDQPHTGDKGAVRVVLNEQGRELFLCVAGSKGFLFHYASSFVQEVFTVLRLPRWGRAEESACVAHLLCQNCVLKGRGPARDTSQASDEICEVLDEQAWATGREGLSVLWGLSRHDDVRGQHAEAGHNRRRRLGVTRKRSKNAEKPGSGKRLAQRSRTVALEENVVQKRGELLNRSIFSPPTPTPTPKAQVKLVFAHTRTASSSTSFSRLTQLGSGKAEADVEEEVIVEDKLRHALTCTHKLVQRIEWGDEKIVMERYRNQYQEIVIASMPRVRAGKGEEGNVARKAKRRRKKRRDAVVAGLTELVDEAQVLQSPKIAQ
eukprot:g50512.t1